MDSTIDHATQAELDKVNARIDKLVADNNLKVVEDEVTETTDTEGES